MPVNLKTELKKNQTLVLVMPNDKYTESIIKVAKQLSKGETVCYVTLTKIYQSLANILKENKVDTSKFYFIDALTQTAGVAQPVENVWFVSAPNALTEMSRTISTVIQQKKPSVLLFDSVSTLLIYEQSQTVRQFIHSLITKISVLNCKGIFTCLEDDTSKDLIKNLETFADKVIHFK